MNTYQGYTQVLNELEHQLLNAIKASDIVTLDRLLHDDLLFIAPDAQVVTKSMDLDSHRAGTMVVHEIKSVIEQINFIGDVAIAIVLYDTKGQMMGNAIEGKFRYIRMWKKFDDGWKVIGGSCLKI